MNDEVTSEVHRRESNAPDAVATAFIEAVMSEAGSAKMTNRIHLMRFGTGSAVLSLGSLLGVQIDDGEERGFAKVHGAYLMERFTLQNLSNALAREFDIRPFADDPAPIDG